MSKAARSIAEHPAPNVAIITGFYIPHGNPPSAETDGPIGAAHLAAGFSELDIPVRLVTDSKCSNAVRSAFHAAGVSTEINFDVIPVSDSDPDVSQSISSVLSSWKSSNPPVSHIISIERVGPNRDGIARNMLGEDITQYTAPLHKLFESDSEQVTIGIGDGGNELGMGIIPIDIIRKSDNQREIIACRVPCNHLIVCGVSNWGAIGLLASLALLRTDWSAQLMEILTVASKSNILEEMVTKGPAVDGVTKIQSLSVDNLPWDVHATVTNDIREIVKSYHS